MDWKTFFSNIISSVAWPLVVVIFLFLFKSQLIEIVKSIAKLIERIKEAEAEYGDKKIKFTVDEIQNKTRDIPLNKEGKKRIEEFATGKEDPKMVIQKAYDYLESAAKQYSGISVTQPFELEVALKDKLTKDQLALFTQMKEIRNMVAHEPITVTSGTSVDYSASALRIERSLKMKILGIFSTQDGKQYDCNYFPNEKEVVAIGPLPPPGHVGAIGEAFTDKAETEADARSKIAGALGPGSF
jgi:Sec-independent protein translocase protein TatA